MPRASSRRDSCPGSRFRCPLPPNMVLHWAEVYFRHLSCMRCELTKTCVIVFFDSLVDEHAPAPCRSYSVSSGKDEPQCIPLVSSIDHLLTDSLRLFWIFKHFHDDGRIEHDSRAHLVFMTFDPYDPK